MTHLLVLSTPHVKAARATFLVPSTRGGKRRAKATGRDESDAKAGRKPREIRKPTHFSRQKHNEPMMVARESERRYAGYAPSPVPPFLPVFMTEPPFQNWACMGWVLLGHFYEWETTWCAMTGVLLWPKESPTLVENVWADKKRIAPLLLLLGRVTSWM